MSSTGRSNADQTHKGQAEFLPDEEGRGMKDDFQFPRRPNIQPRQTQSVAPVGADQIRTEVFHFV